MRPGDQGAESNHSSSAQFSKLSQFSDSEATDRRTAGPDEVGPAGLSKGLRRVSSLKKGSDSLRVTGNRVPSTTCPL